MVTDSRGAPLGKYQTPFQTTREEVEIVRKFLIRISQRTQEEVNVSKKEEATNICYLSGKIKLDPKVEENGTRALIEMPGMKNAIPIGAKKENDGLAVKLGSFKAGDFIQVVCMLDPYGVKQSDGTWKNGLAVKVTAIKNEPPRRQNAAPQNSGISDDDIPF